MACSQGHICQCLDRILTHRRESPVTISGDHRRRRTGRQFVDGVIGLARGLAELGLRKGDVVAVAALNSEWYMEWLLAVAFVGGIPAPLNYRWSLEEGRSAMEVVKPVMLVVDKSCRQWALELLQGGNNMPSLKFHVLMGESPCCLNSTGSVTAKGAIKRPLQGSPTFDHIWAPEDIALICFTSGTTGQPKGVAISHTALLAQSLAKIAVVGYGEDDVYLHTAPLCHIGGISSCVAMLMVGACHVFIPKFDAKAAIRAIKQNHATSLITVPAMMTDLISFLRKQNRSGGGESVRKILNGGGGLSVELIRGATHIFPYAKLISAYGMTEACSSLTFITLHDPATHSEITSDPFCHRLGGVLVGKSPSHIELRISGSNDNSGSPFVGKILTRGIHVMVKYWDHIATGSSDHREREWLDTGDIGWIDEYSGDLWLVGRTKDRIKSGGENVYPEEVEAVLALHPGVSGVVVIGIPDPRLTEMVAACVCIRENWEWIDRNYGHSPDIKQLSSAVLRSHCRQRKLTGFKIPKIYILWRKPFPFTTTGKLKRDEVRKEAISYVQFLPSSL